MTKKIVIIGPESTGKSTLAAALASEFGEPWVPEYAREYLDKLDRPYAFEDMLEIAQGQLAREEQLFEHADRYLFCDTDLHVIQIWSTHKYGKVDPWILRQIRERHYDHYFLTSIDMPWTPDPQREHPDPEMRRYFFEQYEKLLREAKRSYSVVSGGEEERLVMAKGYILGTLGQDSI